MIFDVICLVIILYFVVKGYLNGFIRDTFNLVKYFIIIYVLFTYKDYIYNINEQYNLNINNKVLIFICFILLFLLFTLSINIITKFVDVIGMNPINKWLGIIVAFIKASIIVYICYFCLIISTKYTNYAQNILNISNVANLIEKTSVNDNMITGKTRDIYNEYISKKEEYILKKYVIENIEKGE